MFLRTHWSLFLLIGFFLTASTLYADNEGLSKLDEATDAKVTAETPADLAKVIELCEEALDLGLDESNAKLAK
ncbi:MAG: hypothetical protein R3C53_15420 [Pirellulaceae bacterium]